MTDAVIDYESEYYKKFTDEVGEEKRCNNDNAIKIVHCRDCVNNGTYCPMPDHAFPDEYCSYGRTSTKEGHKID